ncbi:reverse transcriptase domain-containing protein [Tanacetum coccineum]|uniref:Reverse transcriptase domain-containing protein n=1 Tax=Tanacetum coccineum TaxID=301880 RepID=A0ABQ5A9S2_9ASTR
MGELTKEEIVDKFPNEHLMKLKAKFNDDEPWYADYVNHIVGKVVPPKWTLEKKWFFSQVRIYFWDEPYTFRLCPNNVMRRCIGGDEVLEILAHYHSGPTRGHHSASATRRKIYESGFYWPNIFKDAKDYVTKCDACQKSRKISSRSEMPQNNIQAAIRRILGFGIRHIDSLYRPCCKEIDELVTVYSGKRRVLNSYGHSDVTNEILAVKEMEFALHQVKLNLPNEKGDMICVVEFLREMRREVEEGL